MLAKIQTWARDPLVASVAFNLWLILLWYFFGTCLWLFNKLVLGGRVGLFQAGKFPAPFMFTSWQLFLQVFFSKALLSTCVKRRAESKMTWKEWSVQALPNGVATVGPCRCRLASQFVALSLVRPLVFPLVFPLFYRQGLDIGLSNTSLAFVSLSFYTMLKSTTPLFLLLFAILMGLERMSWRLAGVIAVISLGLFLLVEGEDESEFSLAGFFMVLSASALAGLRWAITQVLLQGDAHNESRGGALEIIEMLSPIMGCTLFVTSLCVERPWRLFDTPFFSSWGHAAIVFAVAFADALIALCMVGR